MRSLSTLSLSALMLLASVVSAAPCTIVGEPPSTNTLVRRSDVIVLAVARQFIPKPHDPEKGYDMHWLNGLVRFDVIETIKGQIKPRELPLTFTGRLTDLDEFNEAPVPENIARPEGRGGPCFASAYRANGRYLLLLKRTKSGVLTPYWSALSRVNDQVRPDGDEWLAWVRRQVR